MGVLGLGISVRVGPTSAMAFKRPLVHEKDDSSALELYLIGASLVSAAKKVLKIKRKLLDPVHTG